METHKVMWQVGLSNGTNCYENKKEYIRIKGEPSPWLRLLAFIKENNLKITSMSLYTERGQIWNLPSAGTNPKFKIFCEAEKPVGYNFFRKIGADINTDTKEVTSEEVYTVIEAIYSNHKLQIWVSEQNPEISWSVIIN